MALHPSTLVPSSGRSLLQRRALQCSFSSVFHLRGAGMNAKDAKFVETVFKGAVVFPSLAMGVLGLGLMLQKEKKNKK